jgi:hypothetical protein
MTHLAWNWKQPSRAGGRRGGGRADRRGGGRRAVGRRGGAEEDDEQGAAGRRSSRPAGRRRSKPAGRSSAAETRGSTSRRLRAGNDGAGLIFPARAPIPPARSCLSRAHSRCGLKNAPALPLARLRAACSACTRRIVAESPPDAA